MSGVTMCEGFLRPERIGWLAVFERHLHTLTTGDIGVEWVREQSRWEKWCEAKGGRWMVVLGNVIFKESANFISIGSNVGVICGESIERVIPWCKDLKQCQLIDSASVL